MTWHSFVSLTWIERHHHDIIKSFGVWMVCDGVHQCVDPIPKIQSARVGMLEGDRRPKFSNFADRQAKRLSMQRVLLV